MDQSALDRVEEIAVQTVNRLTIHFDPVARLWRVTLGFYQAESQTLTIALHSILKQRAEYLAKKR